VKKSNIIKYWSAFIIIIVC